MILKMAADIDRRLSRAALLADYLLQSFPTGIVQIVDVHRRLGAGSLRTEPAHTIGVVPFEAALGGLAREIATGIIRVRVGCAAGGERCQTIGARRKSKVAGDT